MNKSDKYKKVNRPNTDKSSKIDRFNTHKKKKRPKKTKRLIITALVASLLIASCTFAVFSSGLIDDMQEVFNANSASNVDTTTNLASDHYYYPDAEQHPEMTSQINSISQANAQPLYAFPPQETFTPIEPIDGKVCYLTFDDGPSENTPKILDILNSYNIKATWFVMNTPHSDYMSDIVDAGHTIALHTYSHKFSEIYASEAAYFADLERIRQLVYDETGVNSNIVRLPGGSSNTTSAQYSVGIMTSITQKLPEYGYVYFDWNVDSRDSSEINPSADTIKKNIVDSYSDVQIVNVLMHDTNAKDGTVEALPYIIEFYQSKGYSFAPITAATTPIHHTVIN